MPLFLPGPGPWFPEKLPEAGTPLVLNPGLFWTPTRPRVQRVQLVRGRRWDPPWVRPAFPPAPARARVNVPRLTKGHRSDPPWTAAAVVVVTLPPPIPRSRVKAPLARKGQRWEAPKLVLQPVQASSRGLIRAVLPKRGHRWEPVWPQVPIPSYPVPQIRARQKFSVPRHGKYIDPPWIQVATVSASVPPQQIRARAKWPTPRNARRFEIPWGQQTLVPARPLRAPVRAVRATRGRSWVFVPDQVPVPVWPPSTYRSRLKPALVRRGQGHFWEPGWPQGTNPVSSGLLERAKMGVGL